MRNMIWLFVASVLLASCYGTKQLDTGKVTDMEADANPDNIGRTELIHVLRTKPGLQISNRGDSYEVVLRGPRSISGPNAPLYVLDGVPLGRDYRLAASSVDVMQIKSVRVITPANAGMYGNRGQNGIIDIKTKRR